MDDLTDGPLTRKVLDYEQSDEAPGARRHRRPRTGPRWPSSSPWTTSSGWARSSRCRTGQQYTEMLTAVGVGDREVRDHRAADRRAARSSSTSRSRSGTSGASTSHVVNSMTVFEFDDDGKIRHLDVYLQQAALSLRASVGRPRKRRASLSSWARRASSSRPTTKGWVTAPLMAAMSIAVRDPFLGRGVVARRAGGRAAAHDVTERLVARRRTRRSRGRSGWCRPRAGGRRRGRPCRRRARRGPAAARARPRRRRRPPPAWPSSASTAARTISSLAGYWW